MTVSRDTETRDVESICGDVTVSNVRSTDGPRLNVGILKTLN